MRTAYQNLSFCLYILKTIIKIKNEDKFSNIADIYQNTTFCSGNESLLLKSRWGRATLPPHHCQPP